MKQRDVENLAVLALLLWVFWPRDEVRVFIDDGSGDGFQPPVEV